MRGVIGLILGIVMIVGGLSGNLVLKGTESGGALAVVGGLLCLLNIYRIMQARANG